MVATILIIDDDSEDRDLLIEILRDVDPALSIVEAKDGQHALSLLDAWQPDLVFLDINMPVLDGYGTITAMREGENRTNNFPIVVYTTSGRDEEKEKCLRLGADLFIKKPEFVNEIHVAVKAALSLIRK